MIVPGLKAETAADQNSAPPQNTRYSRMITMMGTPISHMMNAGMIFSLEFQTSSSLEFNQSHRQRTRWLKSVPSSR